MIDLADDVPMKLIMVCCHLVLMLMVCLLHGSILLCCPWPSAGVFPASVWDLSCSLNAGNSFFVWIFRSATSMILW